MAPATGSFPADNRRTGAVKALDRREGSALSSSLPRTNGCLPSAPGEQDQRQVRLFPCLRERPYPDQWSFLAFQNPEFYRAQAMRLPAWNKPRVIGCAENFPRHIALPRGCLDATRDLLHDNGIDCDLRDERFGGGPLDVELAGTLRPDQESASRHGEVDPLVED